MNLRFFLLLLLALDLVPLRAQEGEPVHMRPEFPLVFPFTNNGKDVTVKYPVMINQSTVIKPGMVLRVLYILSQDSQQSTDLALAHAGTIEQSYARNAFGGNGDTSKLPPAMAHEIEGYRRTVWEVPNNFILAMAQYPTDAMHLIYSPTGKNRDLNDERFSFFDGLFVGSPNGKVTVISVEKDSKADVAGLKAGDAIDAVGNYPTRGDLTTFANAYSAARTEAKQDEAPTYAMTLRGADGATRTANVGMPMRLKSSLMSGFSDKP